MEQATVNYNAGGLGHWDQIGLGFGRVNNPAPIGIQNFPNASPLSYNRKIWMNNANANAVIQWAIDNIDPNEFYLGMSVQEYHAALIGGPAFAASNIYGNMFAPWVGAFTITPAPCGTASSGFTCTEIQDSTGKYLNETLCLNDVNSPCNPQCLSTDWAEVFPTDAGNIACDNGEARVEVVMASNVTHWNVVYEDAAGNQEIDQTTYSFSGTSNSTILSDGDWTAIVTDNNGCEEILPFEILCSPTVNPCSSTNPHNFGYVVLDATSTATNNCNPTNLDGVIDFWITNLGNNASTYNLEVFSVISSVSTLIYSDGPNWAGSVSSITNLDAGTYDIVITDDIINPFTTLPCSYTETITIDCITAASSYDCSGSAGITSTTPTIPAYNCYDPVALGFGTLGAYTDATAQANGFASALDQCLHDCTPCPDNVSDNNPGPFVITPTIGNTTGIVNAATPNCGVANTVVAGASGSITVTMDSALPPPLGNYTGPLPSYWKVKYYFESFNVPSTPQLIYTDPTFHQIPVAAPVSAGTVINLSYNHQGRYTYYVETFDDSHNSMGCEFGPYPAEILCNQSVIYGCTQPLATNYNPLATIDDGSCIYPVNPQWTGCCNVTVTGTNIGQYAYIGPNGMNCDTDPDCTCDPNVCAPQQISWTGCCLNSYPGTSLGSYGYIGPNGMNCDLDPNCACDPLSCGTSFVNWVGCGNSNAPGGAASAYNVLGPNNLPCAGDPFCHPVCGPPGNISLMYPTSSVPSSWNMSFNWGSGGCPCDSSELGCQDSYIGTTFNNFNPVC